MVCGLLAHTVSTTFAQLKPFYTIQDDGTFDAIHFTLTATSGTCHIMPKMSDVPMNIYGDPDFEKINPQFQSWTDNRMNFVDLLLEDYNSSGFSKSISYNMFGPEKKGKNNWEIALADNKEYWLNLNYGIGQAVVDLSGISVKNLNIKTGSADVAVDYLSDLGNKIAMDTFYVKVDLGSLEARKMHLSRAKNIITDIGFGNVTLDFSDTPTTKSTIKSMVGAGSLEVFIPKNDTPVIIYMNNSPLCSVKLPKGYEEVDDNVYVSPSYSSMADNLLTFEIDVALGNASFRYSK